MLHRLVNLREIAVEGELAVVKTAIVDGVAKRLVVCEVAQARVEVSRRGQAMMGYDDGGSTEATTGATTIEGQQVGRGTRLLYNPSNKQLIEGWQGGEGDEVEVG